MLPNAKVLANCHPPKPFFLDEILVEVRSLQHRDPNDLIVMLFVTKDGEYLIDPEEEFIFRNPPVMVASGTRIVEHPVHGAIEVDSCRRDLGAALKDMITHTLEIVLRNVE